MLDKLNRKLRWQIEIYCVLLRKNGPAFIELRDLFDTIYATTTIGLLGDFIPKRVFECERE